MVFGQLFKRVGSFGNLGNLLSQGVAKLGQLYKRAEQVPEIKAKLEQYKVPEFIEKAKQAYGIGKDVYSGIQQLRDVGQSAYGLGKSVV